MVNYIYASTESWIELRNKIQICLQIEKMTKKYTYNLNEGHYNVTWWKAVGINEFKDDVHTVPLQTFITITNSHKEQPEVNQNNFTS